MQRVLMVSVQWEMISPNVLLVRLIGICDGVILLQQLQNVYLNAHKIHMQEKMMFHMLLVLPECLKPGLKLLLNINVFCVHIIFLIV